MPPTEKVSAYLLRLGQRVPAYQMVELGPEIRKRLTTLSIEQYNSSEVRFYQIRRESQNYESFIWQVQLWTEKHRKVNDCNGVTEGSFYSAVLV